MTLYKYVIDKSIKKVFHVFIVNLVEYFNQLRLLVLTQLIWELNIKFENQIALFVVFLDRAKGIVVQNWHSFSWDHFEIVWGNYLVDADFNLFVFYGFEQDWSSI